MNQPMEGSKPSKPWKWVLLGLAGLALILVMLIILAFFFVGKRVRSFVAHPEETIAKMVTSANPDTEVVEIDKKKKKITLRNKKTGETVTVDFSDIQQGKIQWKGEGGKSGTLRFGDQGKVRMRNDKDQNIPPWVPIYPKAKLKGTIINTSQGENQGALTYISFDNPKTIIAFMEKKLKDLGFETDTQTYTQNDQVMGGVITGTAPDKERKVNIVISHEGDQSTIVVTYEVK